MSKPATATKTAPAPAKPAAPSAAAASAAAAAAALTAAAVVVDLKALAKCMKAHMDSAAFADALAAFSSSALSASPAALTAAMEAAHRDPKRASGLYTVLAFAGLCAAHTKQWNKAEECYRKATTLQEEQFPAWKGLYDVYTQSGAKDQLRAVLEKLVTAAPAGTLRQIAYSSQLLRMQMEAPLATDPTPDAQAASLSALLSDPLLNAAVPAASSSDSKDGLEAARLRLELRLTSLLAFERSERADKQKELSVRLERQLKKSREERDRADKLRAQQAASKAGAIAAAVSKAAAKPGAAAPLSAAEEEQEITRKVGAKLERDWMEGPAHKEAESIYAAILALPAPAAAPGTLDLAHRLVHERILARMVLAATVHSSFTVSQESFDATCKALMTKAREILDLTTASPSAYASRILLGLSWTIGGAGSDAGLRAKLLDQQSFLERCIAVFARPCVDASKTLEVECNFGSYAWMAWHALACSIVSTQTVPSGLLALPAPPALQGAIAGLGANPPVWDLAEAILKTVSATSEAEAAAAAAASSAVSSASVIAAPVAAAPVVAAPPSPLCPSFLSPVALAFALQHQPGESVHKETLLSVQSALSLIKSYRAVQPFDSRAARATTHAELTLASAYLTKTLDERLLDSACRIFLKTLNAQRDPSLVDRDSESLIRSLTGLAQSALLEKPRPNYVKAESFISELADINPGQEYVFEMRGVLKLEEARAIKTAAASAAAVGGVADAAASASYTALLQSAASSLLQALALSPSKPLHHLRLGHAYFEQDAAGADDARTNRELALKSFQTAAALATAALPSAPRGASERALQSVASESLAMQGLWWSAVGCDAEQAKKHYVAAMKIDPANDIAGPALCEAILAGGTAKGAAASKENESARIHAIHALASRATASNPRCVWAWLRLARAQMSGAKPEPSAAIVSYQNALRVDNESQQAAQAWQELAECYAAEGQFVAAYKAIAKCVDLTPTAASAAPTKDVRAHQKLRSMRLYLLAKSQLNLGGVAEAVRSLELASSAVAAPFLPALRLQAEALYVQSNVLVNAGAFEAATRALDQAVTMAKRCIDVAANSAVFTEEQKQQEEKSAPPVVAAAASSDLEPRPYISLWKLLGDCYSLYNTLPVDSVLPAAAALAVAASVSSVSPSLSDLPLSESLKLQYLRQASRAYSKCIALDPTNAPAWYDVALVELKAALALHAPAPPSKLLEASTDDAPPAHELEAKHRERGREAAKACLLLSPSNTLAWHLLAVLETRPLVRQHALIQAVSLDAKDCMSWTSLGLVYLQSAHDLAHLGEHESRQVLLGVSRHALEVSQTLDPSNPGLWMAQGLFNQGVGTLEAYVQARACFQRSLELHPSAVARFGLAYTAYCTGELALARFAILKFTAQFPRHASAWNLAGLIFEHVAADSKIGGASTAGSQETIEQAVEAFARAEDLLAVDTQFSTEQRQGELRRMVRTNRARALASAGQYDASITLYQSLIHDAAALGQSGTVSNAAVLAAALTLHVELAMVLARSSQLEQAASIQSTAVAIAASQIDAAPEPGPEVDAERAQQMRHDRSELINKRRGLLLQHAQLLALHGDYDACKQLLQQSVSDHPDFPHPFHYFSVMCVLFASSLAQGDVASAVYALDMARQCMDGLMAGPHSESGEVMSTLLPAFLRIQQQLAVVQGDSVRARRCLAKIVHLNPSSMESWNELYRFVLSSASSSGLSVASILSTATWPSLDKVHAAAAGGGGSSAAVVAAESAWMARQEIVALSFLAVGRVGSAVAGAAAAADAENEAKRVALESKEAEALFSQGGDEDAEFVDEGADDDVRAKGPAVALVLPSLSSSEEDSWPKIANLNAGRISAHMLHLNPTSAASWGIQATALYAQAVQAAAVESASASAAPLFSKAIRMLQLWTSLLSGELTGSKLSQSHPLVASPTHASLMSDLCNCQVMLVDSLLRRAQSTAGSDVEAAANDLAQASQLLRSIFDQQASMGDTFPLGSDALQVLAARLALRQGDEAAAQRHYRAAIECAPLRADLWEELSEVYANQEKFLTAEACLQSALGLVQQAERDGKMSDTASATAQRRLLLRLSMQAYAAQQFERASAWASAATKGSSPAAAADAADSASSVRVVAAVGSSSPACFFLLGLSQVALGHPDQAARAFQAALNLHLAAQDRPVSAALASGEQDAPLSAAASNFPMHSLRFQLALGYMRTASSSASSAAGPLSEAQALLHEELAASAGNAAPSALAPIYWQLALCAHKSKDLAAAASYLRTAIQLRPDTPMYARMLAELDAATGGGSAAGPSSSAGPLPTVIPAPESWEDA